MLKIVWLTAATILVSYLYLRLRQLRLKQFAYFPQLPTHLIWGHLKTFHEFSQRFPQDRHPDDTFAEMWDSLGRPPVMLVDFRPLVPPMVVVSSHAIAEQITKSSAMFPYSVPKSPTYSHMTPLVGEKSMITNDGPYWKAMRKRYNPGFTRQHLWSLLPLILDKMTPFLSQLDALAGSGAEFRLETLVSNLTFDIITQAVLETDFDAQNPDAARQGELPRLFGDLVSSYADDSNNTPWWLAPRVAIRRRRMGRRIDEIIREAVRAKYDEDAANGGSSISSSSSSSRSIVALSLREAQVDDEGTTKREAGLAPSLLSETADQVRTFLFAGHDTNASVLQWAFYELSRTPRALRRVREELDAVLGSSSSEDKDNGGGNRDPRAVCAVLARNGERLLPKLRYIDAVVKETLRLHPPAGTARLAPAGSGFVVNTAAAVGGGSKDYSGSAGGGVMGAGGDDGAQQQYDVSGTILYPCHRIIQRDRTVFGESADEWVPERWLRDADGGGGDDDHDSDADGGGGNSGSGSGGVPAPGVWRAFERGPRGCIGLELANLEARVILAVVARGYDFVKTGLGESVTDDEGAPVLMEEGEQGRYKVKSEMYNTRKMTSKPVDGTMMKVRIASTA